VGVQHVAQHEVARSVDSSQLLAKRPRIGRSSVWPSTEIEFGSEVIAGAMASSTLVPAGRRLALAEVEQDVVGDDRDDQAALVEPELHAPSIPFSSSALLIASRALTRSSTSLAAAACCGLLLLERGLGGLDLHGHRVGRGEQQPGAASRKVSPEPGLSFMPFANSSNFFLSTTDSAYMTMNSAMSTVSRSA
jgi:hypothetical protein